MSTQQETLTGKVEKALMSIRPRLQADGGDVELVGVDATVDQLKGKISARMAVGTKVSINLEAIDFDNTSIRIKVGTFGDKSISLQLLRNIERRLAE